MDVVVRVLIPILVLVPVLVPVLVLALVLVLVLALIISRVLVLVPILVVLTQVPSLLLSTHKPNTKSIELRMILRSTWARPRIDSKTAKPLHGS